VVRHVRSWVVALVSLAIAGILGAWAAKISDEEVIDEITRQHSGDIEIRFSIRSRDGEPLNRVSVRLTKSYLSDAMGDEDGPDRFVVNSEFMVEGRGVSAIHVSFFKDGFYSERWEYVMSERPQDYWGRLYKTDVEIFLNPHPIPAPLDKFEGPFRSDVNGPLSVLSATKKKPPARLPSQPETLGESRAAFPEPYLFLDAGVSANGKLSSTLFSMKRFPVPKPVLDRGSLRLAGAKDGDGFLPLDIGETPAIFEHGFRNIVEAPQNGYSEVLDLYPVVGEEKMFFYCRIGGRFGKGAVTNPPLIIESGGRNVAIANVVIFLNPTGSRDVSYLHH